nr:glycosyltransferase [uncultured Brevundimonas sp.]
MTPAQQSLRDERDIRIAVVVQGLFEKSDSIGFDAIYEYDLLVSLYGKDRVSLFAERFDQKRYPGRDIKPVADLIERSSDPFDLVVYHYCDGWSDFDKFISNRQGRSVVRWHNNTPPWFYAPHNARLADRCVRGFEQIVSMAENPRLEFWVNSEFTRKQLEALGASASQIYVVFPASRYVDAEVSSPVERAAPSNSDVLRILFVGRVVAHKGHRHIVELADYITKNLDRQVQVDFAGRGDSSATSFNEGLSQCVEESAATVNFHGEVDEDQLRGLYDEAHVFVCFSEHEGFGLPVFEAMRCGLPVVGWSRTALGELLEGHPLCFADFNMAKFAAAIEALSVDATWQCVRDYQADLAASYDRPLLIEQIKAALAHSTKGGFHPPAESKAVRNIREDVEKRAVQIESRANDFRISSALDYGENFVTRHDLLSYRKLLDQEGSFAERVGRTVANETTTHVHIPGADFSSMGGFVKGKGIHIPANADLPRHVVFGPYVSCPRGCYRVSFLFDGSEKIPISARLDVLADGRTILTQKDFEIGGQKQKCSLDFQVFGMSEILEFRVKVSKGGSCDIVFAGVHVSRVHLLDQLVVPPRAKTAGLRSLFSWFPSLPNADKVSGRANALFLKADALAESGDIEAATAAYRQGLRLVPNSYSHIIRLGNCLRTSGQLAEAESSYRQVLDVQPHNPEARLQMARLFKDRGQTDRAKLELIMSLAGSETLMEALSLLESVSVDVSDAVALARQAEAA